MAERWKHLNRGQRAAYKWGLIVSALAIGSVLLPGNEYWHAKGPPNVGHEETECRACHVGSGPSLSELEFVYAKVSNTQCLDCHENPDDRHPVSEFRFEMEFAEARAALGVQNCTGCHRQHEGVRTTVIATACQYCHQDTEVEEDPIDVPHAELFETERWETCLGCHDFHGNHDHEVPTRVADALSPEDIQRYLDGGDSPYGYRTLTVMQTMKVGDE